MTAPAATLTAREIEELRYQVVKHGCVLSEKHMNALCDAALRASQPAPNPRAPACQFICLEAARNSQPAAEPVDRPF